MKKSVLLLLLLLTLLAGCQRKAGADSGGDAVVFDSITVDTLVQLNLHAEQPFARLTFRLAYAKPCGTSRQAKEAARQLNDCLLTSGLLMPDFTEGIAAATAHGKTEADRMKRAVNGMAANFARRYLDDYLSLYDANNEDAQSYNRSYTIDAKVERCSDSIANYVADTYYYDGGAHGQLAIWARNFNMRTGRMVRLADLLRPGYERKLTGLIVDNLARQFGADGLGQLQSEHNVFAGTDPYIPDNYIIRTEGITFIYCQDEIAAHATGELRATISYRQLGGLLRKP